MNKRNHLNLTLLMGKPPVKPSEKKKTQGFLKPKVYNYDSNRKFVLVSHEDGCAVYVEKKTLEKRKQNPVINQAVSFEAAEGPNLEEAVQPAMQPSNSYPRKSLQINLLNRPNEVEKAVEKESGRVFNRLEPRQVVNTPTNAPLSVAVDGASSSQLYSPTEICMENEDDEFDVDSLHGKRQSAFDRLGPLTESKKPKLTINLNLTKEQRQVVQEEPYIATCKRPELVNSTNDIVRRYLPIWPWNYTVTAKKSFTARVSKPLLEF